MPEKSQGELMVGLGLHSGLSDTKALFPTTVFACLTAPLQPHEARSHPWAEKAKALGGQMTSPKASLNTGTGT